MNKVSPSKTGYKELLKADKIKAVITDLDNTLWSGILAEKQKIIFNINKTCKFCLSCELIIAKKEELKPMVESLGQDIEDIFVMGILNREIFWKTNKKQLDPKEILNHIHPFKNVLDFEILPRGWYPQEEVEKNVN